MFQYMELTKLNYLSLSRQYAFWMQIMFKKVDANITCLKVELPKVWSSWRILLDKKILLLQRRNEVIFNLKR